MNFLKGYRTIIFNVATVVAALAELTDLINVVSPEYSSIVLLAVGVANLILRYLTDTPVGVTTTA